MKSIFNAGSVDFCRNFTESAIKTEKSTVMEEKYINQIELAGRIGTVLKKVVGGTEYARFSLCTEQIYSSGGCRTVETSWHACHTFASDGIDLTKIEKGEWIHIIGRLEYRKYVDNNNIEKQLSEIIVTKIISDEED